MIEELHTDNINEGHETIYGARSRARERAYSYTIFSAEAWRAWIRHII
jgi:hypothetical protein